MRNLSVNHLLTVFVIFLIVDAEDEDRTISVILDNEESFLSFVDGLPQVKRLYFFYLVSFLQKSSKSEWLLPDLHRKVPLLSRNNRRVHLGFVNDHNLEQKEQPYI